MQGEYPEEDKDDSSRDSNLEFNEAVDIYVLEGGINNEEIRKGNDDEKNHILNENEAKNENECRAKHLVHISAPVGTTTTDDKSWKQIR